MFGDTSGIDGVPDGATLDSEGGLWYALIGGGRLARFTTRGLDRTLEVPVSNPADVTFGGPGLDRLYVATVRPGADATALDGALSSWTASGCRAVPSRGSPPSQPVTLTTRTYQVELLPSGNAFSPSVPGLDSVSPGGSTRTRLLLPGLGAPQF
ncbi:MAG TPA: SMP-30/gluconolactonase/LRE family protein [Acidimicrobiales bacterium]